ncbi:CAP domain-containing protein [uncultured Selenomonas sp.]|uniref:CAP domain-containing protein n=1 Tax=uncultured Selenomonas sp. TaxID=159275 RepID=UPI0025DA5230|nr:CAP domain-containing protein [uncultured Selenomonas sp.]
MKKMIRLLRAGALGTVLAFVVPQVLPAPHMMSASVAHASTDWDAMDEDELAEHLGEMSAEAVIAVMRDEDLDDPDIQSDVEGEIWERAEKAGCDHLLDDETVEQLAKQAIEVAWEEFPSGSLDDEDDDDTTCEDGSCDDEDDDDTTCEDGSCDDEDDDEDYDDDDEDDEDYDDDDDEDDEDDEDYDDDEDEDDEDYDDDEDEDDGSYAEYAEDVLAAVNRNRTAYGLRPLTLAEDLCEDADIRAEEIVSNFSHTRPNGSSCFTIISGSYRRVAENIAGGHATAEETVDQWMNSPPHRANILDPALEELGVGYCHAPGSAYEHYWVQLFRTR